MIASEPDGAVIDDSILTGIRSGDGKAFERLIRTYGPRLLATARRLVRNEDDAAEVLQESFLSAFKALGRFEHGSRLGTWLHRIVVNQAISKLRKRQGKHEVSIEDWLPEFLEDGHQKNPAVEWSASPETLLMNAETKTVINNTIDRLPETYRTVLVLRDVEQLDTNEVAELLCVTNGVVKTRLHRAHQALRELLDPLLRNGDL